MEARREEVTFPRKVLIDTDGGVDDAAALWWAVTDPNLDVLGVTVVWGNVPVGPATVSVARVLDAAGRTDIPIAVGAGGPMGPVPDIRPATFIHGSDGLGETTLQWPAPGNTPGREPAGDLLRRVCAENPGEVSLVTLGPLTNVGLLVRDVPSFAATVQELVVMGGSVRYGGNALPNAEANIGHDPEAAALVVAGSWSRPPLLVGLDVTMVATLTEDHFALLAEHRTQAAAFLDAPLRFYRSFGGRAVAPDCPCHDLLAVLAVADPAVIVNAPLLPLAVDTAGGPSWGATVVDARVEAEVEAHPDFHPWRVSLTADVERFRAHVTSLFAGQVLRPTESGA